MTQTVGTAASLSRSAVSGAISRLFALEGQSGASSPGVWMADTLLDLSGRRELRPMLFVWRKRLRRCVEAGCARRTWSEIRLASRPFLARRTSAPLTSSTYLFATHRDADMARLAAHVADAPTTRSLNR